MNGKRHMAAPWDVDGDVVRVVAGDSSPDRVLIIDAAPAPDGAHQQRSIVAIVLTHRRGGGNRTGPLVAGTVRGSS